MRDVLLPVAYVSRIRNMYMFYNCSHDCGIIYLRFSQLCQQERWGESSIQ